MSYWLLFGGIAGLALLVVFLFWPWEYKPFGSEGEFIYSLATPLYGVTFGLSILAIGIGAVLFQKKFIPEEISIQDRHDGASPEIQPQDRRGQPDRRARGFDPQAAQADRPFARQSDSARSGSARPSPSSADSSRTRGSRWCRPPTARRPCCGRRAGPRASTARPSTWPGRPACPASRRSSRCGPRTSTPAAWRPCSRGASPTATAPLSSRTSCSPTIAMGVRNPVMLIRIRPEDMPRVVKRKGQESFNFGDFFAFTKVCTPPRLPVVALRAADLPHPVPVPPVAVRRAALRQADLRPGGARTGPTSDNNRQRRVPGRQR